jgi:peptidoglycan/xylan/chitin deacetylase (PgdA/CDA1 family)
VNPLTFSKHKIKRLLQRTLSSMGPERFQRPGDNNLLILMYHRVLPEKHPGRQFEQPGMYVSPETFRMHMRILKSRFETVKLGEWVKKAREGEALPRFACAVTFDDGWRDNYEYAYPLLKEYAVPATIFVVSEFIGTRYSFWPNRLMRLVNNASGEARLRLSGCLADSGLDFPLPETGRLGPVQLDRLVEACKAIPEDALLERLRELESGRADGVDMMDWNQLRDMRAGGLVDIGSHTRRHRRLVDGLDAGLMREEIEGSKAGIQEKLHAAVEAFCYPNGDYTPAAVECARRHYAFACTTQPGWNTRNSDFMRLKRIGVHEDIAADRHAFLARLSGLI